MLNTVFLVVPPRGHLPGVMADRVQEPTYLTKVRPTGSGITTQVFFQPTAPITVTVRQPNLDLSA